MYPLKFENIYFERLWGGRDLEGLRENLPEGNIGESWDVSCHSAANSIVVNGPLKGKSIKELISLYGEAMVGKSLREKEFPLLIKLLSPREDLSIQVHPSDMYAKKIEGTMGKTEAWYVVDAKPGAEIIAGVKRCSNDDFERAIKDNNLEQYLNRIPVKEGDFFFIESGMVHALCKDAIIAEIQQSSDITYRVYDYGRPRDLHVKKALEVVNLNLRAVNTGHNYYEAEEFDSIKKMLLCRSRYFYIEKYTLKGILEGKGDENTFYIYTCVSGSGIIRDDSGEVLDIKKGDSMLIPSATKGYTLEGDVILLKTTPRT